MPGGRPPKPKYELEFMLGVLENYTEKTELPILKEVCYKNDWDYDYVIEMARDKPELSLSIKKLLNKKEAVLEDGGLKGKYNHTMVIFSLKQLGWKDVIETKTSNNGMLKDILGCLKRGKK